MKHHHLHASPETCHWGFFEANLKPVLTIESGDEITIDTISGGPEVVPDRSRFHVPPELAEVHAKKRADGARPHPDRSGRSQQR
jgi:acetamidase/formamidase